MEKHKIINDLVVFIAEAFSVDQEDIEISISLVDQGIIDSMGLIEISGHLQSAYGIEVNEPDLNSRNFGSILAMADFVRTRAKESIGVRATEEANPPLGGALTTASRAARQRELMANRLRPIESNEPR